MDLLAATPGYLGSFETFNSKVNEKNFLFEANQRRIEQAKYAKNAIAHPVNIEITKKERGGGRRRGGKRPFGNKDGGGFGRRRSSEKSSGGRRSENNNKNKSSSRRGGDRPDRSSNNDRKPTGFGRKRRERR